MGQRSAEDQVGSFAIEQYITLYHHYVFQCAFRLLGNRQDAEDQTQEIWLKASCSLPTLRNSTAIDAWLSRMTTRTCIDAIHRQRQHRTDSLTQIGMDDGRLATALTHELQHAIATTLMELCPADQLMLRLCAVNGCSDNAMRT